MMCEYIDMLEARGEASDMGFMADFLNEGNFLPGIMQPQDANPRLQNKMSGR